MAYPGGKSGSGVYQSIINLMPPHQRYFEPFLGGGAIMRRKRPALHNMGMDLNAGAVREMRRWSTPFVASLKRELRDRARAGDVTAAGEYAGGGVFSAEIVGSGVATRSAVPEYHFSVQDAFEFFGSFLRAKAFTADDLVYCDPPYVHESRGRADLYEHELSDRDHVRLLRILQRLPCMVMISGYRSALYARELRNWNARTFRAVNRAGESVTEQIWFNFREPVVLHDFRFLGADFRERERIKRKTRRWVSRLQAMPLLERRGLMAAMREAWSTGS